MLMARAEADADMEDVQRAAATAKAELEAAREKLEKYGQKRKQAEADLHAAAMVYKQKKEAHDALRADVAEATGRESPRDETLTVAKVRTGAAGSICLLLRPRVWCAGGGVITRCGCTPHSRIRRMSRVVAGKGRPRRYL